jgi:hypothetical protein
MRFSLKITREVVATEPDYAELSPERKLEILKAMGFIAFWDEHQPDCPAQYTSGIRCICVPPGTSWHAPRDVKEYMHETYQELVARKRASR